MAEKRCFLLEGLRGFLGGALVAYICFAHMMPIFFEGAFYTALIGMVAGIFAAVFTEAKVYGVFGRFHESSRTANLFFVCGAESLLFGCNISGMFSAQVFMGCILVFYVGLFLVSLQRLSKTRVQAACFTASAAFILAALLLGGKGLGDTAIMASAALGGYLLYMGCGEIFPEVENSGSLLIGKLCALLGFLAGILIICKF